MPDDFAWNGGVPNALPNPQQGQNARSSPQSTASTSGGHEMLWGLAVGAWLGLNDRHNDRLVAQGIRPAWSARHPVLAMGLTFVILTPTLLFGLAGLVWLFATSPAFAVFLLIALVSLVGGLSYKRAEQRWGQAPAARATNQPVSPPVYRPVHQPTCAWRYGDGGPDDVDCLLPAGHVGRHENRQRDWWWE